MRRSHEAIACEALACGSYSAAAAAAAMPSDGVLLGSIGGVRSSARFLEAYGRAKEQAALRQAGSGKRAAAVQEGVDSRANN